MPTNPLKKRSKLEQVSDRAELAAEPIREAAASLRDRADSLLAEIDALDPPMPEQRRRPLVIAVVLAGAAAIAYAIRQATSGPAEQPPSPTFTPPGPADERPDDSVPEAEEEPDRDEEEPGQNSASAS
jgi:hypothetical protein